MIKEQVTDVNTTPEIIYDDTSDSTIESLLNDTDLSKLDGTNGSRVKLSRNALVVVEKRYLRRNENGQVIETPEQMFRRIARSTTLAEKSFVKDDSELRKIEDDFYGMMARLEFMPASPTIKAAGLPNGQLSACFVLPVEDSMTGIFDALKNSALIHQSGGGTGFSFSRLRPYKDAVRGVPGIAGGPVSFMAIFNTAAEEVTQTGLRKGANMAVLRVDHPDVDKFIHAKKDHGKLNNFNMSVVVTDKFMEAVKSEGTYSIVNPHTKKVTRRVKAKEIFDEMIQNAWEGGDPGIIFIDRINEFNPTPDIGEIEATNPCGEQPLLPYESCNLGSINLAQFEKDKKVDYKHLREIVHLSVQFLDNVIDVNNFPIKEIEDITRANRKIGLGVMGFADLLLKLGIPYNSTKAVKIAESVMKFVNDEAKKASENLATIRGSFPNFDVSIYRKSKPIRNAARTTIAPTGTISIIADCSSGIEPLFALLFSNIMVDPEDDSKSIQIPTTHPYFEQVAKERGFYSKDLEKKIIEKGSIQGIDDVPEDIQKLFVTAHDIDPIWHVKMQAAFQKYTDNAVSKTINFPNSATIKDVRDAYLLAYETGCKGITIYRDGSRDVQALTKGKQEAIIDSKPKQRPQELEGKSISMKTGCGHLYVTINKDENGEMFELFNTMGKAGGCAASQCEAIGRLVSLAWRSGIAPAEVYKELRGISCHRPHGLGKDKVLSCADAIGQVIGKYIQSSDDNSFESKMNGGACPDCGGIIELEGGCCVCRACGYAECG